MSATTKRSPSQSKDITTSTSSSSATTTTSSTTVSGFGKTPVGQTIRDSVFNIMNRSSNGNNNNNNSGQRSPISPSRFSRLQEKEEMQNLNERLVIYIDTVRRLETDNVRLQNIITTYSENSTKDVAEIKSLYERELEDAKRLIDELAKDKARFEIDVNKHKADAEEAIAKLSKREKDLRSLESKLKAAESEALEFKGRYESLLNEQSRNREELSQLKPQVADLEKQLSKLKKQLEDETLLRVDLENKNQTLKEDLAFKTQVYDKEIDQMRSSKRTEIEQVDVRLRDEYDSRLVSELQRIREEAEYKITEMKDEVERRYHNKLSDAESQAKRHAHLTGSLKEEVTTYKTKCDELQSELKSLQGRQSSNENKIRELEDKLNRNGAKYEKDLNERDTEIIKLRKELHDLLLEYQELYDIKIALDMEISAYRKLLESEEQRLNISSLQHSQLGSSYIDQSTAQTSTSTRGGKKRRMTASLDFDEPAAVSASSSSVASSVYTQSQQTSCGIEIVEHDFEGKCVKLLNTNDREVSLSGWLLRRNADNQIVEFKFAKSATIKAGQTLTVWSANVAANQREASDLAMSGQQRWFVGDSMITVLLDKDSTEQARRESQRNVSVEKKLRGTPIKSSLSSSSVSTTSADQPKAKKGIFGLGGLF